MTQVPVNREGAKRAKGAKGKGKVICFAFFAPFAPSRFDGAWAGSHPEPGVWGACTWEGAFDGAGACGWAASR